MKPFSPKSFSVVTLLLFLTPAMPLHAVASPNKEAIAEVTSGKRTEARAAWWGFDPADSTAVLQAAINSGAHKLIVEDMGAPWITDKLKLASDQEIVFEKGVVVLAKRGAFRDGGDCLFSAASKKNITLAGHGATLRMWKQDYDVAGIDFEPNAVTEELVKCVVRNCASENNKSDAYQFHLLRLRAESKPELIAGCMKTR